MLRTNGVALLLSMFVVGAGCGGDDEPTNFEGTYSLSLTNGANGCAFPTWTEGQTTQPVQMIVVHDANDRSKVSANVEGLAGGYLTLLFGSSRFEGTANGDKLSLKLTGRGSSEGECRSFTPQAVVSATLMGDLLTGTIGYSFMTDGSSACGIRNTCASAQSFNGTRPPTGP